MKNIQNKLLKLIFFLILLIAIFHAIALHFYLYDELWWIDIVMHSLGGAWLSLFISTFIFFSGFFYYKNFSSASSFFTLTLGATFFIGVLWEIFEFKTGLTFLSPRYWPDTISDVVFDVIGGTVSSIYTYYLYLKIKTLEQNNK